jgi:hypothetical protein
MDAKKWLGWLPGIPREELDHVVVLGNGERDGVVGRGVVLALHVGEPPRPLLDLLRSQMVLAARLPDFTTLPAPSGRLCTPSLPSRSQAGGDPLIPIDALVPVGGRKLRCR